MTRGVISTAGALAACLFLLFPARTRAATYRVWALSPANGPGSAWSNAFHTIQGAVDAATNAGDVVLVTNGLYLTGATATPGGALPCRIVVTNSIRVQSVNGPELTVIAGQGPLGDGAVRCAYLTNAAVLSGFTLYGGYTMTNGTNNYYLDRSGGGAYADGGILTNCLVVSNNSSECGGGVERGQVVGCLLTGNTSVECGGGADEAQAYNSVFHGNSSRKGGGASYGVVSNCLLTANSASYGGATAMGEVNNSVLVGNTAAVEGGACYDDGVNNCTAVGNSCAIRAGGAFRGTIRNSIVYFNTDPGGSNVYGSVCQYVCTVPAAEGAGNITNMPGFADYAATNLHLLGSSMCINAGNNDFVPASSDIEGNPRVRACVTDMGAYESPYAPIDAWAVGNGTIAPSGRVGVLVSSNQSFSITPGPGHPDVRNVKVDGAGIGPTNSYTFYALASNHTIEAVFRAYIDTNDFAITRLGVVSATNLVLVVNATNGWRYSLQHSDSMAPQAWSNVVPHTNLAGAFSITITNAIAPGVTQKFYRVRAEDE